MGIQRNTPTVYELYLDTNIGRQKPAQLHQSSVVSKAAQDTTVIQLNSWPFRVLTITCRYYDTFFIRDILPVCNDGHSVGHVRTPVSVCAVVKDGVVAAGEDGHVEVDGVDPDVLVVVGRDEDVGLVAKAGIHPRWVIGGNDEDDLK